uniref:Uncharacterized protein n=1 Tax=Peromyscus maniculatus bairdii TaxID=230844 RepID=A0A8C8UPF6_PERMB
MAAAGEAALGIWWLQKATRSMVPLGAPQPSRDQGMLLGPYPRTPEEQVAAAKKYKLCVEDSGWSMVTP